MRSLLRRCRCEKKNPASKKTKGSKRYEKLPDDPSFDLPFTVVNVPDESRNSSLMVEAPIQFDDSLSTCSQEAVAGTDFSVRKDDTTLSEITMDSECLEASKVSLRGENKENIFRSPPMFGLKFGVDESTDINHYPRGALLGAPTPLYEDQKVNRIASF